MNAEIIAVGSEMLTPSRADTNSLWLTGELNLLGVEVVAKIIVGDDRARLTEFIGDALRRSQILILTGGLGPTEDDLTRECVAEALGRKLEFSQEVCDAIAERFRQIGRAMAGINRRQAYVIEGSEVLPNPNGTAPGLWLPLPEDKFAILLPGPPKEMKPMWTREAAPRLSARLPEMHIRTLQFRIAGMGESDVDALTSPVYTKYANPVTTILAKPGDVELHFRARAATPEAAQALLDEIGPQIEALLGDRIYSRNGDPLEAAVGARLRERAATLATAESCSGGLLAERITSVAGSSDYFLGGFVAYSAAMKESALGVDGAGLLEHGVYSDWTAQAMAEGARARTGATYGIGITGVAGPGPDGETPPGTVYIAASGPDKFTARKLHLFGDRDRVRFMATQSALDLLRKEFLL